MGCMLRIHKKYFLDQNKDPAETSILFTAVTLHAASGDTRQDKKLTAIPNFIRLPLTNFLEYLQYTAL